MLLKKSVVILCGLSVIGIIGFGLPAQATTYYVSSTGGTALDGLSEGNAVNWVTARGKAAADPATNDTIVFLPGVYNRGNIGATGRDDCLIDVPTNTTIKAKYRAQDQNATPSNRSVIKGMFRNGAKTPVYQYVLVDGRTTAKDNVVVDGFEIDGTDINGSDPTQGKSEAGGISLVDDCHNVQMLGNLIHDLGGGGLGSYNFASAQSGPGLGAPGGADYVTARGNRIYNCCSWFIGGGGGSGISFLGLSNTGPTYEDGRTVHNFIQQNRVYNNRTKVTDTSTITDNNGIIIDLAGGFDNASTPGGYDSSENRRPAQTLIENNVVYGNDGRGIHIFKSSNVLVRNNTCYQNLQLAKYVNEGEISAAFAKDLLFVNNIAYADGTNQPLNSLGTNGFGTGNGNVVFRYNSTGNGTNVFATGTTQYGNITGVIDNDFYSVATSDFRNVVVGTVKSAQRAIDVGSNTTSTFPNNNDFAPNDFYGANRPIGTSVDRGAFETSFENPPLARAAKAASAGAG